MKKFKILLYIGILSGLLVADEVPEFTEYKSSSDAWPTFSYPSSWKLSPKSRKGERYKWTVILESQDRSISMEVSAHGFVPESYKVLDGFNSPRDVVLIKELRRASQYIVRDGYEIFVDRGEDRTVAIFLKKNSEWGLCYNSLSVSYPAEKADICRVIVDSVINTFKPSVAIQSSPEEAQQ